MNFTLYSVKDIKEHAPHIHRETPGCDYESSFYIPGLWVVQLV
jgi:hypothetical protein